MLSTAMLLLAGLGCQRNAPGPAVVEFWAMGSEGEVVQQLVPAFERRRPGVRVRVQQIPWSAAHEKLLTAYVGGAMPDVFQVGNTWIPELVALNAIAAVDDRITRSPAVQRDDYFAGILDTNILDGRTYGVPWYVDTRLPFYRTDILQQVGAAAPPATWDGWLDAMRRIRALGRDHYAILLPLTEWQTPVMLAFDRGADLLRDHDQYGDFRGAAFRDAFGFYLSLFEQGLAARAGDAQVTNLYQDFANAYFAIFISGPWNVGELQRRLPARLADAWSTTPMPNRGGATSPGISLAGGASLALFRDSPRRDAAWQWIEYLSEPAQQVEFYRLTGDLPARRSAWADPTLAENRYAAAFWQQLQHVRATPKIPEWERIADKIGQYADAAIRGTLSADAALTALDADVDALLEKRRWLLQRHGAAR